MGSPGSPSATAGCSGCACISGRNASMSPVRAASMSFWRIARTGSGMSLSERRMAGSGSSAEGTSASASLPDAGVSAGGVSEVSATAGAVHARTRSTVRNRGRRRAMLQG
jgi:hypothetical protein